MSLRLCESCGLRIRTQLMMNGLAPRLCNPAVSSYRELSFEARSYGQSPSHWSDLRVRWLRTTERIQWTLLYSLGRPRLAKSMNNNAAILQVVRFCNGELRTEQVITTGQFGAESTIPVTNRPGSPYETRTGNLKPASLSRRCRMCNHGPKAVTSGI